ncbi:MAG: hypothetical protein LUF83_08115 [Alistipes sp.]|nr:hypothetical protein [Alistipes sp.]
MIKKSTLFVVVSLLASGCIEPDDFGPEGTYTAETRATVKAASLEYADAEREPYQLQWSADDAVDLYYAPTKVWTTFVRTSPEADVSVAGFSAEQEWEYGRRSHIFYAIAPSQALAETAGTDPSELQFELAETQLVENGIEKYMVSSALALVKESAGEKHVELELSPALSLLDLELSATSDLVLKTLSLTSVGAGAGKGLTGPYKLDAATTTVNMRTTTGNSVTLDFGEGLTMEKGKLYQARAVVLPAKLAGLNFSVSGSTSKSSLELSVCEAADLKQGAVNRLSLSLSPGPIRQDYTFTVTSGAIGEEANNKQLTYLGANKTQSTAIKGIRIAESKVDLEYESGETKSEEAFWEAVAPDWIVLSQTSGKGAVDIDVMVLPNLNPLKNGRAETTTDLSADGTANTYLVHAPGTYRFDARVMGNGDAGVLDGAGFTDYNGAEITSAALTGGATARVLWQECINQITEVKYDGSAIEFTTSDHVVPCNAVVALCDGAGRIVWSWQIWFTDELNADDVIVNANTNETAVAQGLNRFPLMDRNLGAMCRLDGDAARFPKKREGEITIIQYTDESKTIPTGKSFTTKVYQHGVASNSYYKPLCYCGMKYQWGRKDPFVSPYTSGNWPAFVRFDGDNNEIARIVTENGGFGKGYGITLASGITAPDTYYKSNSTTNWLEAHNFDLWGNADGNKVDAATNARPYGVKTIYDPCPPGYMVPTIDAFTAFSTSWIVGSYLNGYFFRGSSSDTAGIFFPAAGEINSGGSLASMGADSYYYTGSITRGSNNSHQLQVKNGTVNNNFNTGHGNGRTVRCMRETR